MSGRVSIWESTSGRCTHTLEGPGEAIEWVSWHPRGDVVLAGSEDFTAWMWNAQSGDMMQVSGLQIMPLLHICKLVSGNGQAAAVCYHPLMPHHTLQCNCCTFHLDVRSASSLVFPSLTVLQLYVAGAFVHCMCALYWYTKCTSNLTISLFRAAGVLWAHRRSALWPIHTRREGSRHWWWRG